jgi:natural product precursor
MKIKLSNGLNLSKESLAKLQESQMAHIKGGGVVLGSSSGPRCTCKKNSCQGNDGVEGAQ